jgi:hypothetical protein
MTIDVPTSHFEGRASQLPIERLLWAREARSRRPCAQSRKEPHSCLPGLRSDGTDVTAAHRAPASVKVRSRLKSGPLSHATLSAWTLIDRDVLRRGATSPAHRVVRGVFTHAVRAVRSCPEMSGQLKALQQPIHALDCLLKR